METDSNNRASFHIDNEAGSDAHSECESTTTTTEGCFDRKTSANGLFTKAQPLTSKQQVALWLTKTSMTSLSSMPSLKSLMQFNQKSTKNQKVYACGGGGKRPPEGKKIQRNFSTKSLTNTWQSKEMTRAPIRKCETVIALSGTHFKCGGVGGSGGGGVIGGKCIPTTAIGGSRSHCHVIVTRGSSSNNCKAGKRCKSNGGSRFNLFNRLSTGGGSLYGGQGGSTTPRCPGDASYATSTCESPYQGMRPVNRLRSRSSIVCSRCNSVMSVNTSRMTSRAPSQLSLLIRKSASGGGALPPPATPGAASSSSEQPLVLDAVCKICLSDYTLKDAVRLEECGCSSFCRDCLVQYITFEIMEGAYEISCPDSECEKEGALSLEEMEKLVGKELVDKHRAFRLNTEVALDANRTWCPQAGCNTICHLCSAGDKPLPVECPTCEKEFCSLCSASWHPGLTCQENGTRLVKAGANTNGEIPPSWICDDPEGNIKQCPMCKVPIERNAGCAQMMCKRCKHVFCWYCQTSLDDDFLLRHYDSGQCKGKLGHSRASVLWHRAQVIAIFAGFGVLLLVASPLLLIAAPCILCCRCKYCQKLSGNIGEGVAATAGVGGGGRGANSAATPLDNIGIADW